ncbi:MAG: alcohol dehydrogenase catalytic domain-containing protein [Planctomycetes bacterium]|nr:alcohol dehydrogenase catalytic domain-containing protein [Planctomycetota bacterium]
MTKTMRAINFVGPGQVELIDDAAQPEPKEGEVLVQCSHVALCGTNMGPYLHEGRWGDPKVERPPGWLGHENVGRIVALRCDGWEPGTWAMVTPRMPWDEAVRAFQMYANPATAEGSLKLTLVL